MSEPIPNLPVPRGNLIHHGAGALDEADQRALEAAVRALEYQPFAMRVADTVGRHLGTLAKFIPSAVSGLVDRAAKKAIETALGVAVKSLAGAPARDTRRLHKAAAVVSGAAGGVFGLTSIAVELPVSTVIILRSIADIARNAGEDLADPETIVACLEVFALGAHEKDAAFIDSGYFATRGMLATTVSEASRYIAAQGLGNESAPILVRLISQIAARFGIVVSEKVAAQAVPILGAAGGAAVNYAFADHFQAIAHGHFTVRRLERSYGRDLIRAEYERLATALRASKLA